MSNAGQTFKPDVRPKSLTYTDVGLESLIYYDSVNRGESVRWLSRFKSSDRWPDWRGWIALLWVLWWGWAYGVMAIQARGPLVLAWLRTIWR
jgi:hypothetical protein